MSRTARLAIAYLVLLAGAFAIDWLKGPDGLFAAQLLQAAFDQGRQAIHLASVAPGLPSAIQCTG